MTPTVVRNARATTPTFVKVVSVVRRPGREDSEFGRSDVSMYSPPQVVQSGRAHQLPSGNPGKSGCGHGAGMDLRRLSTEGHVCNFGF